MYSAQAHSSVVCKPHCVYQATKTCTEMYIHSLTSYVLLQPHIIASARKTCLTPEESLAQPTMLLAEGAYIQGVAYSDAVGPR